ncbi:MAG: type II toxin-antitoxin system Phd/YefM family antitoxin [Actinomycetota bacterium]|jgi:prevent-host-death family protein|nr:type II toxin-antitoxin system Phd/YefM family antitoxin [Actinomycetota bacterium]
MATRLVPKTELRDRIRDELAELGEDTIVVTERGRPLAVAISVERWNALQETMENLEDALAVAEVRLAEDRGRPAKDILEAIDDDVRGPTRATG